MVYLQIARTVKKMLAAQDPAKINCPIIFTELGFAAGGKYSSKIGTLQRSRGTSARGGKYYTMGIAQGINCVQWFEAMDGDSGPMGLLTGKSEKRPGYNAPCADD